MCFRVSGSCVERYATADEDGDWTVDYSGAGVVLGTTKIEASESNSNGNKTIFDWLNPYFWVWPKYGAGMDALNWPLGHEI